MLNYQRLWQFWGFFIFEMEWSPLGTLRCYHCDGGPCHVWLPRVPYSFYVYILSNVSHHPQNENKRYCGTPTTEFRSLRIGLWWFGAPENRVFTIWVWGGTDFLGNGHSSEIYIYIYYIIFFVIMPAARNPTYQVQCTGQNLDSFTDHSIYARNSHIGSAASARNPQSRPLETHLELPMPSFAFLENPIDQETIW